MITADTDGFKVFAAWNHQGMILPRCSRAPAQLAKFDTVSDPGASALGRKDGAACAKSSVKRRPASGRKRA
jgi:hypothetical protein